MTCLRNRCVDPATVARFDFDNSSLWKDRKAHDCAHAGERESYLTFSARSRPRGTGDEDDGKDQSTRHGTCVPAEYVAFEREPRAPGPRLDAMEEMLNAFESAQADPATAEAEAQRSPRSTPQLHNLKAKVQGRKDAIDTMRRWA